MICKLFNVFSLLLFTQLSIAQSTNGEHVISVDQVSNIADSRVVILHVAGAEDYAAGHLPNAINVTRAFISDSTLEYGGVMATKDQMESLLGKLGVAPTNKIILYDDKGGCDATRLWWILSFYGHNDVVLLDGGLQAWKDKQLVISKDLPTVGSCEYAFPKDPNGSLYARLEDVQLLMKDSNSVLLDVRTFSEFTGEIQKKGAFRKGRIPGSILMDWVNLINYKGNGKLKPIAEIQSVLNSLGITKEKDIIVYCHSGVRSSHTTFVLTELLGYKNVRNYDGSWIEWSFNDKLPIETGEIMEPKKVEPSTDFWWLLILPIAVGLFFLNRRNLRK
ncbi:MAG: thiosulfate/3-mercaptopyruvate sulfurtransferase [Flavobacteriaceae bacterium]|jgi:thiosulfate/3-mercaptopyruvate sulfurtransferase